MNEESRRKDYIWNSIAGLVNASEAVVMSMVVTRFGRLADAGILSLAFALGNVLMTIGKFGGRMYQVTDIKRQYSFNMYFIQRLLTVSIMMISLIIILIGGGYIGEKRTAIICITLIYFIESFEECIWGHYQSFNKLYIGAKMFSIRWIAILVSFIVIIIYSHNMILALWCGVLSCVVAFFLCILGIYYITKKSKIVFPKKDGRDRHGSNCMKELFRQTFPLFLASFCSIFLSNLPKFVIDRYLTDEVQACYGFVAMPVFVIGLLNQFIYQPTVVRLTNVYYDGKIEIFKRDVRKQLWIVCGIMAVCVMGAGLLGVPVLSILYHTDLRQYWKELVILQVAGGFLAMSGYLSMLLTLMRIQKIILAGYIISLLVGIFLLSTVVKIFGTVGASLGYLFVMIVLYAIYYFSYKKIVGNRELKSGCC